MIGDSIENPIEAVVIISKQSKNTRVPGDITGMCYYCLC